MKLSSLCRSVFRTPNRFAVFVKDNYKDVRTPGVKHADAMKELGKMFARAKLEEEEEDNNKENN